MRLELIAVTKFDRWFLDSENQRGEESLAYLIRQTRRNELLYQLTNLVVQN
jgi:hypothetical protein